jgi:hypothetical protein
MIGRPCPLCGNWFYGTATQPAACNVCITIARFERRADVEKLAAARSEKAAS